MLTSCLNENGRNWHLFCNAVAYGYNSFALPSLGNYSPYYLVHLRHPPTLFNIPTTDSIAPTYQDYVELLKARLQKVGKTVLDLQYKLQHNQAVKQARKAATNTIFTAGMLVYLLAPTASALQTASKKIRMDFVGPLVIKTMADSSHAILGTLEGQQLTGKFHVNRL